MQSMINNKQEVVVTDVKMPFWSIVRFMVKAALASIPALIIVYAALFLLTVFGVLLVSSFGLVGQWLNSPSTPAVVLPSPTPTATPFRRTPTPLPTVEPTPTPDTEN